ncbi:MAG: hypothetical protein R2751_15250 [Bacteroidales bacterium]
MMKRREYMHAVARGGFLGALLALAGVLIHRQQLSLETECTALSACAQCKKLGTCTLPAAAAERNPAS